MKTAVSLPDELFGEADKLAKRLHLSRSALFAAALGEFVARHGADRITEQLDRVYGSEDSRLPAGWRRAQARGWGRQPW